MTIINRIIEVIKKNGLYSFFQIVYIVCSTIYLMFLSILNQEIMHLSDNALMLISYKNGMPIYFFLGAILLFIIGIKLIFFFIKEMKTNYLESEDTALLFVYMIMLIVFMVLIFLFINNPILRAILAVLVVGGGSLWLLGQ
jgi:hypothetical protein